jgi:type I restriction enzyme R subunit
MDLILILAEHGYPPVPQDEVFKEIFEQAENFKKYEQADDEETGKTAQVISMYPQFEEEERMMMAAENIFIYGSIPVDLPNTKRNDLIDDKLDLVLMYAIGRGARQKTEVAGKIALGIKEDMLKDEQMAAYKSIKYLMFHYWSNPTAYLLTKEPKLVDRDSVPSDYLLRMEKDAVKYLLLDYNPQQSSDLDNINILKTQRRGEIRYLPFVTTIDSIVDE